MLGDLIVEGEFEISNPYKVMRRIYNYCFALSLFLVYGALAFSYYEKKADKTAEV